MTEPDAGALVLCPVSATEVIAFGRPTELDLLGSSKSEIDRPFVDAMRTAVAAAPHTASVWPEFGGSTFPAEHGDAVSRRYAENHFNRPPNVGATQSTT